ncbi:hypothetical protein F4V47_04140 [Lactococcus garvieae subsp. garvieae]|uniref:zinc ribbon domain-containing protein n=1 Tax=Lactococcus garvieae TaxID=1363 RepID=UPI0005AAFCE6|nr:zinc ribbon domain-containing protein [Lactococcus garvieae]KAA8714520.1 hypothetical protein F4V47_04140 [Lactococcus garvieae subsp. garvieae]MDG6191543.1 zinc ribbon domain-containing protein [Lactococcus garvieae]QPR48541.1 zinc ribbon domain-containing protein [Lactococcus garvieae]
MTKKVFCQSCGMPLAQTADFGTESNGQAATEYCRYCYQNGAWTQPNITLEETIALGSKALDQLEISGFKKWLLKSLYPMPIKGLKRWKK